MKEMRKIFKPCEETKCKTYTEFIIDTDKGQFGVRPLNINLDGVEGQQQVLAINVIVNACSMCSRFVKTDNYEPILTVEDFKK